MNEPTVNHLSYSACRSYCTSPMQFKRTYLERREFKSMWAFTLGKTWHKGLELYEQGDEDYVDKAIRFMMDEMEKGISDIDEKEDEDKIAKDIDTLQVFLEEYASTKRDWKAMEHPDLGVTEVAMKFPCPVEGGLPMKCVTDIWDSNGNPTDYKYVSQYTNQEDIDKYYVQAWFNYHATVHAWGIYPDYFRISEWKKTRNACELKKSEIQELLQKSNIAFDKKSLKDPLLQLAVDNGLYTPKPQLQDTIIIYKKEWLDQVGRFYVDISKQIQLTVKSGLWIPNPFQMFGGEDWKEYLTKK